MQPDAVSIDAHELTDNDLDFMIDTLECTKQKDLSVWQRQVWQALTELRRRRELERIAS